MPFPPFRQVVAILAVLACLAACGPVHEGRTVSSWVEQCLDRSENCDRVALEVGPVAIAPILAHVERHAGERDAANIQRSLRAAAVGNSLIKLAAGKFDSREWTDAVEAMAMAVANTNAAVRDLGLIWITRIGSAAATSPVVDSLARLLNGESPEILERAAKALEAVQTIPAGSVPRLLALATSAGETTRVAAIRALGYVPPPSIAEALRLVRVLTQSAESRPVVRAANFALGVLDAEGLDARGDGSLRLHLKAAGRSEADSGMMSLMFAIFEVVVAGTTPASLDVGFELQDAREVVISPLIPYRPDGSWAQPLADPNARLTIPVPPGQIAVLNLLSVSGLSSRFTEPAPLFIVHRATGWRWKAPIEALSRADLQRLKGGRFQ